MRLATEEGVAMKRKPARRKPSLNPHSARTGGVDGWWYEDKHGIDVYEHCGPGVIAHVRIYWSDLLKAAKRCGVAP